MVKGLSVALSLGLMVAADLQAAQVVGARLSPQGAAGIVQGFFGSGARSGFDVVAPVLSLLSSHAPGDPAMAPVARELQAAARAYLEDRASPEHLAQVGTASQDAGELVKSEALTLLAHPLVLDLLHPEQARSISRDYRAYREALADNRRASLGSRLDRQARALQRPAGADLAPGEDVAVRGPALLPERAPLLRPAPGEQASFKPAAAMAAAAAAMPLAQAPAAQDAAGLGTVAVFLLAGAVSVGFLGALLVRLIRRVNATLDAVPADQEIRSFVEAESLILDYEQTGADGMSSRHVRSYALERDMGKEAFERMLAGAYATSKEFKSKYSAHLHPWIARVLRMYRGS